MKLNRFFFLIRSGVKSIFTHGFMSFASVTIIMACLIIMGSFSLVAVNINRVIDALAGVFSRKKPAVKNQRKPRYHYSADESHRDSRSDVRKQFVSEKEERIDAILEKIKQSGYASLTKEEKELLFSVGKK